MAEQENEVSQEEVIIGARALGEQIYKIMPTYQVLLKQLEEIRQTAKEFEGKVRNQDTKKQDINNTIGIFGSRGTGKSSALYTLREDLFKSQHNILLPLIEPDNFGENTKIIGSIVGLLQAEGNKLLKTLEKSNQNVGSKLSEYYNNCILKPNNPLKQIINETVEYHLYTESQYRNMLSHHYDDLATHIKKSSRLLIPDITFKSKFNELINEIVGVKKALNESEEPILIYIFIDDIDLKTSKTRELMDALLRYTDHPNIVTVLSGDYEILTESLTLALLADEPLREIGLRASDTLKLLEKNINFNIDKKTTVNKGSNQENQGEFLTILGRKSGLAHEYLKKIIPPARRHQLVKWSEETIPSFAFGEATLLSQLAKLMGEKSIFSYMGKGKKNEKGREIEREAILPIKKSYTIFDERPRGIVNVYYHLVQLLKIIESEYSKEERFSYVKVFVDTLIVSNKNLLDSQGLIFEKFLLWGSDAKSSSINYPDETFGENNLDLEMIIIGEIVLHLLPEVKYDIDTFEKLKLRLFSNLVRSKHDQDENNVPEYDPYFLNRFRLYHMIIGIALYTDLRSGLLLVEYLSDSSFKSYYYQFTSDPDRDQKDRFVVLKVAELIQQYPTILEQLYRKSNIDKLSKANYTLNTLQDLCTIDPEFEKTERVFQGVLRSFVIDNSKHKPAAHEELRIRKDLFTNNLTIIRNKKQFDLEQNIDLGSISSSVTVIAQDQFRGLARTLAQLNDKLNSSKRNNIPDSVLQTMQKSVNKFGEYLFKKLFNENFKVNISLNTSSHQNFLHFFNNYAGNSTTTIYWKCKIFVYEQLSGNYRTSDYSFDSGYVVDLETYKRIIVEVESLARNNRVWFGQKEARDFLVALKNISAINDDTDSSNNSGNREDKFFKDNERYILEQYYEYITSIQEFSEYEEYDKAKVFVKEHMDAAYEKVRNQTALELEEFDLNLEDAEDSEVYGETNA